MKQDKTHSRQKKAIDRLIKNGINVDKIFDNHWRIDLEHEFSTYSVTIKKSEMWFSYAAELMPDIKGDKSGVFYQFLLDINSKLNGAYIARQEKRLILVRNEFTEDINEESLLRDLAVFHRTHEYIYDTMLKKAQELNLAL
ncbi:MAG: hypothetical protein ACPGWR_09910 [Ardenticatenaceae bacterium]